MNQRMQNGSGNINRRSPQQAKSGASGRNNPAGGNGNAQRQKNYYNFNNINGTGYPGGINYSVKNTGNMSGAGVLQTPGNARDAGRYRERLNGVGKTYPNRRDRITTGKELTTPLRRKAIIDAREKARRIEAVEEKVKYKYDTVAVEKKRFPVSVFFILLITTIFLLGLICTYIVLNERNVAITKLRDDIISEETREKILIRELDVKNDLLYMINYAVNDLHMISDDLIQKHYVSVKSNDKVEIIGEKNNIITEFPNIMSAIFKK